MEHTYAAPRVTEIGPVAELTRDTPIEWFMHQDPIDPTKERETPGSLGFSL